MYKILTASAVSNGLRSQLLEWFEGEWGDVDSLGGTHPEVAVPSPVVAVDDQNSLLGGLSFTSAPQPKRTDIGVWINMVLIAPSQRKKGIASKLVRAAEVEAARIGVRELYVLTEFPDLYRKLGWDIIGLSESREETILINGRILGSVS